MDNNNDDIEKDAIKKAYNEYQHSLESDFEQVKQEAYSVGKKVLVVGAVFALGYFVTKGFIYKSKAKRRKKNRYAINGSQNGVQELMPVQYEYPSFKSIIKSQLAVFVGNMLKRRLIQFLDELNEKYERESYKES